MEKFVLRDYQEKAVKVALDVLTGKPKKSILVEPTGSGKSLIIAKVVKELNEPVIILQPSKVLLKQNYSKFCSFGGEATLYCASLKEFTKRGVEYCRINGDKKPCKELSSVIYATIGSIKKEVNEIKKLGVKKVIVDECFPSGTPIVTDKGVKTIKSISDEVNSGETVYVKSYNEKLKIFEYNRVTSGGYMGVKELLKIDFHKLSFECTPNHKILTLYGWVEAKDLEVGVPVITSDEIGSSSAYGVINEDQEDFLTGTLLGDGSIDIRKFKNSFRVRLIHGVKQEEYLRWKASLLSIDNKVKKINNNGYSKGDAWVVMSPVIYSKKDISSPINQINNLNKKSLAVLWMDDGHMGKEQNEGSLYTLCTSKKLIDKLNDKIKSLGVRDTVVAKTKSSSTGRELWYIRFRKSSILDISFLCSKYVHKSMKYKIHDKYKKNVGSYKWNNRYENSVKILKNKSLSSKKNVYDLEVEKNNNFVVTSRYIYSTYKAKIKKGLNVNAQGVVVHNCHLQSKVGSQMRGFLKSIGVTHVLGLTATPVYLESTMEGCKINMINRSRYTIFKDICHVHQISEIIKNKYWTPIKYVNRETDETCLSLNSTGTDYTDSSKKAFLYENDIESKIVEEVKYRLAEGRKRILIFMPTIEEANSLKRLIRDSVVVHSKLSQEEKDKSLEYFDSGAVKVAINVNMLGVGYDNPILDTIINARPTNSIAIYYQMVGRMVRLHKDKTEGLMIDYTRNLERFGRIEGLTFEKIPYYGWGMFNERNECLSGHILIHNNFPTKESLIQKYGFRGKKEVKKTDIVLRFGRYKGNSLDTLFEQPEGRRYCQWLVNSQDFNWGYFGDYGVKLKKAIIEKFA